MKKPVSVKVVEEDGVRVVIAIYADGEVKRTRVDPTKKPARKPRKPFARARTEDLDRSRKKRF